MINKLHPVSARVYDIGTLQTTHIHQIPGNRTKRIVSASRGMIAEGRQALIDALTQVSAQIGAQGSSVCISVNGVWTRELEFVRGNVVYARIYLPTIPVVFSSAQELTSGIRELVRRAHALQTRTLTLDNQGVFFGQERVLPPLERFASRTKPRNYKESPNAPAPREFTTEDIEAALSAVSPPEERKLPPTLPVGGRVDRDVECAICFTGADTGVTCECEEPKSMCAECVGEYTKARLDSKSEAFERKEWEETGGRVKCPCGRMALSDFAVLSVSATQEYLKSRSEYEAVLASEGCRREEEAKRRETVLATIKALHAPKISAVEVMAKHIQDYILTPRCPKCSAPYGGYVKCSCLMCDCGVHFCAFCRDYHDADSMAAHRHVLMCQYNPQRGESYGFTSEQETASAVAVRRAIARATCDKITEYIVRTAPDRSTAADALFRVSQDAIESGIPEEFVSGMATEVLKT